MDDTYWLALVATVLIMALIWAGARRRHRDFLRAFVVCVSFTTQSRPLAEFLLAHLPRLSLPVRLRLKLS